MSKNRPIDIVCAIYTFRGGRACYLWVNACESKIVYKLSKSYTKKSEEIDRKGFGFFLRAVSFGYAESVCVRMRVCVCVCNIFSLIFGDTCLTQKPLMDGVTDIDRENHRVMLQHYIDGMVQQAVASGQFINSFALKFSELPDHSYTPLMAACQRDHYNKQFGCHLTRLQVAKLVGNPRVDVNFANPTTGVTALFFAVKYTDLVTVDLLLEAGANPLARDTNGRTALKNAVERACPEIVARLLQLGCSANERIDPLMWEEPGDMTKNAILCNAAETLILGSQSSFISWQSLGPPSSTDLVSTFHLLLRAGAKLGLPALQLLQKWGQQHWTLQRTPQRNRKSPEPRVALATAFYGIAFPLRRAPAKWTGVEQERDRSESRILPDYCDPPAKLLAARSRSDARLDRYLHKHRKLSDHGMKVKLLGTQHPIVQLRRLTNAQLQIETVALGLDVPKAHPPANESTGGAWSRQHAEAIRLHDDGILQRNHNILEAGSPQVHLASASASQTAVIGANHVLMPPMHGYACIQASVSAIGGAPVPVCAFLSTCSALTILPTALADHIGAPHTQLRSNRTSAMFKDAHSHPIIRDAQLIKELVVHLSPVVSVTLRNAVCSDEFDRLQLGIDFFTLATRSTLDVLVAPLNERFGRQNVSTINPTALNASVDKYFPAGKPMLGTVIPAMDGGRFWTSRNPCIGGDPHEELRFHTEAGSVVLQVFHSELPSAARTGFVELNPDIKIEHCDWCGRFFPRLFQCGCCKRYGVHVCYCSGSCQRQAWSKHKAVCGKKSQQQKVQDK